MAVECRPLCRESASGIHVVSKTLRRQHIVFFHGCRAYPVHADGDNTKQSTNIGPEQRGAFLSLYFPAESRAVPSGSVRSAHFSAAAQLYLLTWRSKAKHTLVSRRFFSPVYLFGWLSVWQSPEETRIWSVQYRQPAISIHSHHQPHRL